ncbi:T9SS type A sorting domain-containing protein [uncultured Winogradskyella sp.]|uniref:T9SS type A sorting domain-containing protein n=1 Tax=uncultured Winogradskyella sp. TaxID=395353 RepID=UPI0026168842|nr:T9SS type A sorting domain-containing protein [uncultured Winogradskyella sp.]
MKKQLLFLAVIFTASFQFINAQCTRSGSFVQSDPAYSISGDANITFTTSGDKDVIFESNFATVQGADLRVYVSKMDDIKTPGADAVQISSQLMNDGGGTGGPGVSPITGMMTFALPPTVELSDFDYIVIECIVINERWGYVALGANTGADCASLSLDSNTLSKVAIYPNPSNGNITLQAQTNEDAQISVYNILGNRVYQTTQSLNSEMDLSNLKTGIYLVKIEAEGKQTTKRLIIE